MDLPFDLATVEAPFFEPLIGQRYAAQPLDAPGEPPLEVELIHVHPLPQGPRTGARAPFSLLLKPADPARMRQGIHECTGSGLEREPIFLVPVRDPLRGLALEAVFT